jgi:hypothetical protein
MDQSHFSWEKKSVMKNLAYEKRGVRRFIVRKAFSA